MKRFVFPAALVVLLVLGCPRPAPEEGAVGPYPDTVEKPWPGVIPGQETPEDRELSEMVFGSLTSLLENQDTNDLVIVSLDGDVFLRGRVANVDLKHDISRHVLQLPGVERVNNDLEVDPAVDLSELRLRNPEEYKRIREDPAYSAPWRR
jgi:hypothetical protein